MSNLKQTYREYEQYLLQCDDIDSRENQDIKEILGHIALILAEDYVKCMKNASSDQTGLKGGGTDME